jgi:hypothetical protein
MALLSSKNRSARKSSRQTNRLFRIGFVTKGTNFACMPGWLTLNFAYASNSDTPVHSAFHCVAPSGIRKLCATQAALSDGVSHDGYDGCGCNARLLQRSGYGCKNRKSLQIRSALSIHGADFADYGAGCFTPRPSTFRSFSTPRGLYVLLRAPVLSAALRLSDQTLERVPGVINSCLMVAAV